LNSQFKEGQVVIAKIGKREFAFKIRKVVESLGSVFYLYNNRSGIGESSVRALTPEECGLPRSDEKRQAL